MKRTQINSTGNLTYDFSFAKLAIAFLETGDTEYLHRIADLDALKHIMNHATTFHYDVPKTSTLELATFLLSPIEEQRKKLPTFTRNLNFAIENIANTDIAQQIALQYLPTGFAFSSSIFFTFGYDIGVAYGQNCSINLAHKIFLQNMNELKYYAIHELHHAGFMMIKQNIPSFDVSVRGEMAQLIAYLTHLEGMGTFAPLEIRQRESAMNTDKDYVALQDVALMQAYEREYFEIYQYFQGNPEEAIVEEDWQKLDILSDIKRLWYRVGAMMASVIDHGLGREKLVSLIDEPSENFIATYLSLKGS